MKALTIVVGLFTMTAFVTAGSAVAGNYEPFYEHLNYEKKKSITRQPSKAMESGRITQLVGFPVENLAGEKLGEVDDVIVDHGKGRIAYIVFAAEGPGERDEKLHAFPYKAFSIYPSSQKLILNMDKEQLARAPGFDRNSKPQFTNRWKDTKRNRFYGIQPAWEYWE
jgi:sporulation protein YlmC with PRC-barrel domain